MKFEELKEKFEKSNKYCLYLSYEDIHDLFIHIGKLKTRNTRQAIIIDKLRKENEKLRQCHFMYEEITGIDLLLK